MILWVIRGNKPSPYVMEPCLDKHDKYFFLGEYVSGKKSQFSDMNQLIINFKKPMPNRYQQMSEFLL